MNCMAPTQLDSTQVMSDRLPGMRQVQTAMSYLVVAFQRL